MLPTPDNPWWPYQSGNPQRERQSRALLASLIILLICVLLLAEHT